MSVDLGQFDRAREQDTWLVLSAYVPDLKSLGSQEQISAEELFTPSIARRMAELLLLSYRRLGKTTFLTDEQLFDIASEEMGRERARLETDIAASPGVYVFVSVIDKAVLKVGRIR